MENETVKDLRKLGAAIEKVRARNVEELRQIFVKFARAFINMNVESYARFSKENEETQKHFSQLFNDTIAETNKTVNAIIETNELHIKSLEDRLSRIEKYFEEAEKMGLSLAMQKTEGSTQ